MLSSSQWRARSTTGKDTMMRYRIRRYSSFLVRRWSFDQSVQRVIVEHIQSGQRSSFATLGEAMTWMETARDEPGDADAADFQTETGKHDLGEVPQ